MRSHLHSACAAVNTVPSDNHLSIVTWCFPTLTTVPGGRVPAGACRGGITVGVARGVEFDDLENDEFCDV